MSLSIVERRGFLKYLIKVTQSLYETTSDRCRETVDSENDHRLRYRVCTRDEIKNWTS